jgi:hypothetical protein
MIMKRRKRKVNLSGKRPYLLGVGVDAGRRRALAVAVALQ